MEDFSRTLIRRLASWSLRLRMEEIPERVLTKARCQLLSVVASVYAGSFLEEAQSILKACREWFPGKDARVLSTGESLSWEGAILANASFSMAHDYDDYLFMGHTGHSAVLVSLALSEMADRPVRDFLAAQVAANEIAGRLGASALLGPLNGQMWSFIHLAASACAAGRLLGLTAPELENAFGIALSQPTFPLHAGFFGSGSKLLTAAWPSVQGLQAVLFARGGLSGSRSVLDPKEGLYKWLCYYPIEGAWDGLGETWLTETIAIKKHPGCAYLSAAVDALESILERVAADTGTRLQPSSVESVTVRASLLSCEMERLAERHRGEDLLPVFVNFSLRYSLAWILLNGGLRARELTRENLRLQRASLEALVQRVELLPDPGWNARLAAGMMDKAGLRALLDELGLGGIVSIVRQASRQLPLAELADLLGGRASLRAAGRGGGTWVRALESARSRTAGIAGIAKAWRRGRHIPRRFSLGRFDPGQMEFPFGASVTLRTKDGITHRAEQPVPVGAPGNTQVDLPALSEDKFRSQAEAVLSADQVKKALCLLSALPPDMPVREVVASVAKPDRGIKGSRKRSARVRNRVP